jgi:hypothetical protein
MLDLSPRFGGGTLVGTEAKMRGGAMMGDVLDLLEPQSRLIPIGVARIPGMGLATRGGVGYLTRSAGLTLDHVREIEIVLPSGEVRTLSDESKGDDAELWWAVRGVAPHFGVVTSVTFRSRPGPMRVFAQRLVYPLESLSAYFEIAPTLPRDISASALLGRPQDPLGPPVLFLYIVLAGESEEGITRVRELTAELTRRGGASPIWERGEILPYPHMPSYDVPPLEEVKPNLAANEARWGDLPPVTDASQRLFKFEKCPFLKGLDAKVAVQLIEAIRKAPTTLCRVDLQHCGGALGDVSRTATAFWNRDFEWNCPIIAAWIGQQCEHAAACTSWGRHVTQILEPYTVGSYSVEITPGLPETNREVELAFGENLRRLQQLKQKYDPNGLLPHSYSLTGTR